MKEWQIANLMFGKNTKVECTIVKKLMKSYTTESLCDFKQLVLLDFLLDII